MSPIQPVRVDPVVPAHHWWFCLQCASSCANACVCGRRMQTYADGNYACFFARQKAGGVLALPRKESYRPDVSPAYGNSPAVQEVITAIRDGEVPDSSLLRDAVRVLLRDLSQRAPGRSVEVRVPPFGAVQCIGGPRHTRGTPPNVIETDAVTWVKIATGALSWEAALASGAVSVSGVRADLSAYLPLAPAG